ncbi:hypothetical protein C823_002318 [Eubacterium plexicaudatum ASF492]|uniref:HTH araC/xylS-type domain-containing protein n=1 Tax=Eubacterium plexicaudatum ASF492 TaxID=1235802 RepID=N2BC73_9FIRM|nr:hypothetical protein C823_002318 [Eubacterium plexicaudatum ASF492]
MTQAAFELQRTDEKVIDLALKYGYSSPTSFHRAFQSVHGIAPTAAKATGSILQAYAAIQFRIEITGGSAMVYHIAEKQPLHIVGIRIPLVCDPEENLRIVPDFWKATLQGNQFSELCKLSNQEPNGILECVLKLLSVNCASQFAGDLSRMRDKSPTKWGVQMAGMNFKTHSRNQCI